MVSKPSSTHQERFVNVYRGRASFELGVEVGRLTEPDEKANLYEIVACAGAEKAEGFGQHVAFQVSSREEVQEFVPKLARLIQKYGAPFLKADAGAYRAVHEARSRAAVEYEKQVNMRNVRMKAETAWHGKDYAQVIELYDPVREDLTDVEAKRLTYAEQQVLSTKGGGSQTSALGVSGLLNTIGRESSAVVAGSQAGEVFSYDKLGRVKINSQCTPQNCSASTVFPINYAYDLLGDTLTATNGMGVTFTYPPYNRALRITGMSSSLSDSNHPGTLYSSPHYNGAGSVLSAIMGNPGSSVSETRIYDGRLRLTNITDGSLYTLSVPTNGYAPDSNILQANDSVNGNWTYGYDALNRLTNASATGQSYTYNYDRFGNRWHQTGPHSSSLSFSGNNNRMDTYSYDAAGNLLNDGTTTYTYDSENRIISATNSTSGTSTYQYDADGRRIRKTTTARGAVDFLYDLGGHEISEVNSAGVWWRGELYAGGRHLGTYSNSTTYFTFSDWLGTERARSTSTGAPYETCTSLPFGDWLTCTGSFDSSPMHFTGKERDFESGLDNFGARYDSSQYGRFMTPDPSNLSVDFWLPQTWNRYSYALNNPLTIVDRNGLWPSYTHERIVDLAFPGMSAEQLVQLKNQSFVMDYAPGQQGASQSPEHGMRNGSDGQTVSEAQQKSDEFILKNQHEAQQLQAEWIKSGHTGICPAALSAFGNVLHTVTDRTSPAHAGYQPWYGQSAWSPSAWWHFLREANPYDPAVKDAVRAAQDTFRQTFGNEFNWMMLQLRQGQACVSLSDSVTGTSSSRCD